MKLSVIGCGYLGATHAACMSSLGFEVVGVDTDQHKVDLLSRGELPFYEPGLDTLLAAEMKTGRLSFTTDFSAVADADVHFICVGTPQSKDGLAADLTYVKSSVAAIAPHLKDGALVVGKSTVPVGTAQSLRDILATSAPQADLAWNPEFLREGFAVEDTLTPNRLVVGVVNDRAEEILKEVYKPIIGGPVLTRPAFVIDGRPEGARSADDQVLGSYLHGMFDAPGACGALLRWAGLHSEAVIDTAGLREESLNRIAEAALPLFESLSAFTVEGGCPRYRRGSPELGL